MALVIVVYIFQMVSAIFRSWIGTSASEPRHMRIAVFACFKGRAVILVTKSYLSVHMVLPQMQVCQTSLC